MERLRRLSSMSDYSDGVGGGKDTGMVKSGKLSILRELWDFMKVRKKWWLGPIVLLLLLLGMLLVFTQGSALAPFIYTLF
jgi:hypothetical protein